MSIEKASPYNVEAVRDDFPVLGRTVDGEKLVYLDNAATSQKPQAVIDAVSEFYEGYNANVHRGLHKLSQEASEAYEGAHDKVAEFIGADGRENIIFTSNTTEGVNTVAFGWGMHHVEEGDNIVLTQMEHHSSLVPWQQVAKRNDAELRFLEVEEGLVKDGEVEEKIDEDTTAVSVIHMSNVFGTFAPVDEIIDRAHEHGARVLVDGAQSVPHASVNVNEMDADFLVTSGHKMCGPTGTGVLYGKTDALHETEPYRYGGEMIKIVEYDDATWADLPWKFEGGTPNIAGAVGLSAAVDYLEELGVENVHEHESAVTRYALELLEDDDEVTVYGPHADYDKERAGVISFNVSDAHPHDSSQLLSDQGIATRSGHHCAQPLMREMGVPATTRASFYLYNTYEEVDALVEGIETVKEVFA
ncbi:SufS family cysteine desulfurase [Haladaptatus sp. F3-133]|uniref:cysteine desulfurase n=1 Tax=Halorutilus salinus TaxID=2487751 RepID=A0A9Q4C4M0_9EURY|nr:SufS family cysteine desulfurase [Halorutilus salinus]MCX2818972.1 SufS family cysteine desulfurase [Halorutilus salinus]